ncbi:MAG TPA: hypothetical protein VMT43_08735 [Acidimicrobiales bacterium]|nr:hypothetical protein [Acidimicrobiales bacterium]
MTDPSRASALEFRLTDRQRRRYGRGLVGLALIAWSVGLVRLAVTQRLDRLDGWAGLAVLGAILAAIVAVVRRVEPLLVLDDDAARWQWGPRRAAVAWSDVSAVEVRERGIARRVLLVGSRGRTVLPVPLTGGSLIGPGPDPELDDKVDVIRRWWEERRRP